MNRNTSYLSTFALSGFATLAFACTNSTAIDDSPLEPSRDSRIESLASSACARYADTGAGCPGYGTGSGQTYATEGDCERAFSDRAADLWPADKCSDGRIDSARYQSCESRAKAFACSSGVTNIFDAIEALDECKASQVCIDAP